MRTPMGCPKFCSGLFGMWLAATLVGAVFALPHVAAAAEQRVALVIGNSAYPSSPLRNPVNDANAMAGKLRALGFEVILRTNVTQRDMNRAVVQFGEKLTGGSVGLFYYAGHGLQVRGKNYLVPIDAEINSESAVRSEGVDVDQVLDQFASTRLSMVILDACRNNPFERRFRAGQGGGLAQIDAPKGTLIAYATAPGKTAADGAGANGVYTEQLLKAMDTPGTKVEDVFKQVRINVAKATQDQQIPWEASSLTGEFFFRGAFEKPVLAAPAPAPAPSIDSASFEMAFWDSIKTSNHRSDFEAYLEQYPKGRFAPLARSRAAALPPATPSQAASPSQAVGTGRADSSSERAELIKTLEEERKKRDRDAEAAKQELEKLRAELLTNSPPPAAVPQAARTGEIIALAMPAGRSKPSTSIRALKIGDSWTYQLKDLRYNKTLPTITLEIVGGDASGIQEILRIESAGKPGVARNTSPASRVFEAQLPSQPQGINRLLSLEPRIFEHQLSSDVTLFEFAPFLTQYSELTAGVEWPNVPGAINNSGESKNIDWRFSGKVVGRERISIPAGNFDAIKIELEGLLDLGPIPSSTRGDAVSTYQIYTAWFAPEVGRMVKYTRKTFNRLRTMLDDDAFDLVSYSLK